MKYLLIALFLVLSGCDECVPGEKKCAVDGWYHMRCEDGQVGGNWVMVENCLERCTRCRELEPGVLGCSRPVDYE